MTKKERSKTRISTRKTRNSTAASKIKKIEQNIRDLKEKREVISSVRKRIASYIDLIQNGGQLDQKVVKGLIKFMAQNDFVYEDNQDKREKYIKILNEELDEQ